MSYVKHTWVNNEAITASKMNNIETGIEEASQSGGGGALICSATYDSNNGTYTLDKTAEEIYDALLAGTPAYIKYQYGTPVDYSGILYLAPIIKFSNYNYTSDIKIYASKPIFGTVSNTGGVGRPGVLVYSAGGLDQYPEYDPDRTSSVFESYIETGVGID